jgi:hypothetical protein
VVSPRADYPGEQPNRRCVGEQTDFGEILRTAVAASAPGRNCWPFLVLAEWPEICYDYERSIVLFPSEAAVRPRIRSNAHNIKE